MKAGLLDEFRFSLPACLPSLERFPGKPGSRNKDQGSRIADQGSRIEDRGSGIGDLLFSFAFSQ